MKYFYGPDTYAAREAIEKLAREAKAHIRFVDREQLEEKHISDIVAGSRGLFGTDMVVVRDPSSLPKHLQEVVVAYIKGEGAAAQWIAWDRSSPDKRSILWRVVKPYAHEFPQMSLRELSAWLVSLGKDWQGSVEVRAAEMLVARVGMDRWRLTNELQRLLLVADGVVDVALVEREHRAVESAEIFATLDALVTGNEPRALASVELLLVEGQSEFYVLSMLAYQFRTLLLIRAGIDQGSSLSAIAQEAKLHPFVVEKNMAAARRLPLSGWRDIVTRILATDFAIKQGRVDARTGLLMLMMVLSKSMAAAKLGSRV